MAKKNTKRKTVKARKAVAKRKTVKARKVSMAKARKPIKSTTVFRQPLTAIQSSFSSFMGYFK